MDTLELDAYDLGWIHGYNDRYPENPYDEGSAEYAEYEEGYRQGSADC